MSFKAGIVVAEAGDDFHLGSIVFTRYFECKTTLELSNPDR
jgi:hypothetical protein